MRSIILLVLFQLSIQDVYCIDNILSKFHQNTYKIRDYRADIMRYNKDYFNKFEIRTFKYNRTTPAINGSVNLKVNMLDKIELLVQCYKFLSNEYRYFPVRFQVNLMKAIKSNVMGLNAIKKCGNITTYDIKENVTYYACNFVIDETHLPPLIPTGRYKVDATLLYLEKEIAFLSGNGDVYTPTAYPKNEKLP